MLLPCRLVERAFIATLLVVVAFVYAGISTALGCCGALLLVPTTDVVPYGGYSLELQQDSSANTKFDDTTHFVNTEFGLAANLEAGVDFDVSQDTRAKFIANGKYRFGLGRTEAAMAVGIQSIDSRLKSIPFLTASVPLLRARLHTGILRSSGNTRLFGGFDVPVNDRLTLMGDYIAGDDNFTSAGLAYAFTKHFALLTYAQYPNDGSDKVYSVHLVFCGSPLCQDVNAD